MYQISFVEFLLSCKLDAGAVVYLHAPQGATAELSTFSSRGVSWSSSAPLAPRISRDLSAAASTIDLHHCLRPGRHGSVSVPKYP